MEKRGSKEAAIEKEQSSASGSQAGPGDAGTAVAGKETDRPGPEQKGDDIKRVTILPSRWIGVVPLDRTLDAHEVQVWQQGDFEHRQYASGAEVLLQDGRIVEQLDARLPDKARDVWDRSQYKFEYDQRGQVKSVSFNATLDDRPVTTTLTVGQPCKENELGDRSAITAIIPTAFGFTVNQKDGGQVIYSLRPEITSCRPRKGDMPATTQSNRPLVSEEQSPDKRDSLPVGTHVRHYKCGDYSKIYATLPNGRNVEYMRDASGAWQAKQEWRPDRD